MGFSRQEYWSGLPFPSPGHLLDTGVKLTSLTSPASAGGFFTASATWQWRDLPKFPDGTAGVGAELKGSPAPPNHVASLLDHWPVLPGSGFHAGPRLPAFPDTWDLLRRALLLQCGDRLTFSLPLKPPVSTTHGQYAQSTRATAPFREPTRRMREWHAHPQTSGHVCGHESGARQSLNVQEMAPWKLSKKYGGQRAVRRKKLQNLSLRSGFPFMG